MMAARCKRRMMKTCPVCGRVFVTHDSRRRYCSAECAQEHVRASARLYSRKRRMVQQGGEHDFVLVSDALPLEEGGFRPGVEFSTREVAAMLAERALVPGTRLRSAKRAHLGVLTVTVVDDGDRLALADESGRVVMWPAHGVGWRWAAEVVEAAG